MKILLRLTNTYSTALCKHTIPLLLKILAHELGKQPDSYLLYITITTPEGGLIMDH